MISEWSIGSLIFFAMDIKSVYGLIEVRNAYVESSYIPCVGYSRDCYPGLEYCYERRYCLLDSWLIYVLILIGAVSLLAITLIMYYVLEKKTTTVIILNISLSIISFSLVLAILISVGLHEDAEVARPTREDEKLRLREFDYDYDNNRMPKKG